MQHASAHSHFKRGRPAACPHPNGIARPDARAPMEVTVAKATLGRDVAMEGAPPREVRLQPGEPLRMKVLYRIDDPPQERDEYLFYLATRVDGHDMAPVEARWPDHRLPARRAKGTLAKSILLPDGAHNVEVYVQAEQRAWDPAG